MARPFQTSAGLDLVSQHLDCFLLRSGQIRRRKPLFSFRTMRYNLLYCQFGLGPSREAESSGVLSVTE
jgi:hypothetical protein